jgi:hypothetical protein
VSKENQKHWLSLELGKHDVAVFYSRLTQLEVILISNSGRTSDEIIILFLT